MSWCSQNTRGRSRGTGGVCGLVAVPTLTKTRTDALVVAEAGLQSGKAKNSAKRGKPVITAEEFLEWVG